MPNHTFRGLNMTPVETFKEAMDYYGMDFPVLSLPLLYNDPSTEYQTQTISPFNVQIVNGKSFQPIAVVGLGYNLVEYPIALSFAEELIKGGAKIVGGGCPNRGERAYLVLDSEKEIVIDSNNKIINRFVLLSSHDGTGKIEVRMTPWWEKVGTAITFDATRPLAFKHTKNVHNRVSQVNRVFKSVNNRWAEFNTGVQKMLAVYLTEQQAYEFVESILPTTDGKSASTRLENIRSEIITTYRDTGIGCRLPQCRGTLFGLVQAVVEWADIKKTIRKSNKRDEEACSLDAKIVMDSAKKKQKAWAMALYLANKKSLSGVLSK